MLDFLINNFDLIVKVGAGILTLLPIILYIKTKMVLPVTRAIKNINKIEDILYLLGPNGGKSLYDKIVNIDNRLAKAEVRSKSLIAALEIAEWQSNVGGECVYVNSAACQLLNRSSEDFLGRNWVNVIHPEDRERVVADWDTAIKEKRNFVCSYRWTHSDGHAIAINVEAHPAFDSSQHITGWIAVVRPQNK